MCAEEGPSREVTGEFRELLRYTVPGYLGGLLLGVVLDRLGLQRSGIGQWLVRTLAGEGESVLEGVFAVRRRLTRAPESMAEAYGWGKLAGMAVPWVVDWVSRRLGVEIAGVQGFYIPYLYALSDQIGANVSGFAYLRRREGSWPSAARCYVRDPVMVASLAVILVVPLALLLVRAAGFSPTTQVRAALETIAANLCWVPPVVGWVTEQRRERRSG
ncbi:MAG: hypothetical protein LAO05_00430 [Acidobacteriia bacterium]|nr:hypothetical protein [Terriglobia bacterium]